MEFTPKKQIISIRRAPYTTGAGQNHYKRLRRITPSGSPRTRSSSTPNTTTKTTTTTSLRQKRFFNDRERINNARPEIIVDGKGGGERSAGKTPPSLKTTPVSTKRPFSAVNGVGNIKDTPAPTASSPYDWDADVFEDEKDPYAFPSYLDSDTDKENTANSPQTPKQTPNGSVVAAQRMTAVKSYPSKRKLVDVSRSRLLADISPEKVEKAYGINYRNSGEAEKENAHPHAHPHAQANTSEFVHLQETTVVPHLIGFPNYGNTCYLNSVVQALFGLSPFVDDLQAVTPSLHLLPTSLSSSLNQVIVARSKGQIGLVKQSLKTVKENLVRVDGSFSGFKMQDANEFLTRILDTIKDEIDLRGDETTNKRTGENCGGGGGVCVGENERKVVVCGGEGGMCQSPSHTNAHANANAHTPTKASLRNPIKDNFEFQLFESYRCDGCKEVEGKKQEYFGLYVNLPEENGESVQEALSACMGEDERELKCNNCGHNRTTVVTSITKLPRILIVQLKRYAYKAEQGESVKRSWRVPVTRWLHLDRYVSEASGPPSWNTQSVAAAAGNGGPGGVTNSSSSGSSSSSSSSNKNITLSLRNLSSEMNVCEGRRGQEDTQDAAAATTTTGSSSSSGGLLKCREEPPAAVPQTDKEDDELQEVMRRSMDDFEGTREEDEIQQAIRLSLQDLGMSYAQENQCVGGCAGAGAGGGAGGGGTDQEEEEEEEEEGEEKKKKKKKKKNKTEEEEDVETHTHSFRLVSVISHFGCTTNTGHYVADVYNCEERSWFHYDDETVSKIPESVVLADGRQKNAYIFFYVHKDIFQEMEKKVSLQR